MKYANGKTPHALFIVREPFFGYGTLSSQNRVDRFGRTKICVLAFPLFDFSTSRLSYCERKPLSNARRAFHLIYLSFNWYFFFNEGHSPATTQWIPPHSAIHADSLTQDNMPTWMGPQLECAPTKASEILAQGGVHSGHTQFRRPALTAHSART